MIKIKYRELSEFSLAQTIQKVAATPTNTGNAVRIRNLVKAIQTAREDIRTKYISELVEVYAARTEDGSIKRPENEPNSFEPNEAKLGEFRAAEKAFGENEVELDAFPLTPASLVDMKLSAKELEDLHGLFCEQDGLGVPGTVHSLR